MLLQGEQRLIRLLDVQSFLEQRNSPTAQNSMRHGIYIRAVLLPYIYTYGKNVCLWGLCCSDAWGMLAGERGRGGFLLFSFILERTDLNTFSIPSSNTSHMLLVMWGPQHKPSKLLGKVASLPWWSFPAAVTGQKNKSGFESLSSVSPNLSTKPYPGPCNESLDSHDLQAISGVFISLGAPLGLEGSVFVDLIWLHAFRTAAARYMVLTLMQFPAKWVFPEWFPKQCQPRHLYFLLRFFLPPPPSH